MEYIKTVTTDAAETAITFDDFYPYIWIRSFGAGCYVSPVPGIQAGGVDVAELPAGGIIMIHAQAESIYVKGTTTIEVHAQMYADCPWIGIAAGGSGGAVIEALSVTVNGTYTAPSGVDGYSPVTVDVQEQPWQPLQDGYSNFWFELTNDTLSPWLNFSAKTEDAVIDWGDGSGEVALDTLTPTHTYSKAGKYVVKVKGVTGIAQQQSAPYSGDYVPILTAVELNNEIQATQSNNNAFLYCTGLKNIHIPYLTALQVGLLYNCTLIQKVELPDSVTQIGASSLRSCFSLSEIVISDSLTTIGGYAFANDIALSEISLPNTLSTIGTYAFASCSSLATMHIQAKTPPSLGASAFNGLPSAYIIYVPVGYGDTYKAAAGWSAYADHILEEGQTPNRAMLSRLAKAVETDDDVGDMR